MRFDERIVADNSTNPETILFADALAADAEAVRDALETLPRPYRLLLLSLFYEGVSHAEVAHRLSVHRNSVDRLIPQALKELQHRLENGYANEPYRKDIAGLLQGASYRIRGNRPSISVRAVGQVVLLPDFYWTSTTSARVEGILPVLRVLDVTVFHRNAPPVTFAAPGLMREFAESRLLRPGRGLTPFEKSVRDVLNK